MRAVIGDLGFKHTQFGWELRRAASRSKSQSSAKLVTFLKSWRPSFEIVRRSRSWDYPLSLSSRMLVQEQAGIHNGLFCGIGIFRISKAEMFHHLFDRVHRLDSPPASHIRFVDDLQQVGFDRLLTGEVAIRVGYSITCCFNRHYDLLKRRIFGWPMCSSLSGTAPIPQRLFWGFPSRLFFSAAMRSTTLSFAPTGASLDVAFADFFIAFFFAAMSSTYRS